MKKTMKVLLTIAVFCIPPTLSAQVGYNNPNPDPSAVVDIQANDKGLLIPRMTSAERGAMAIGTTPPAEGLLVFDTDLNRLFYWDDDVSAWRAVNFADVEELGGREVVRVEGDLGLGVNDPDERLDVDGNAKVRGILFAQTIQMTQTNGAGAVPQGAIIMWSGSPTNIPHGYALCNGNNGTPDLRDRFVVGAGGGYAAGSTGGQNEVTLSEAQTPLRTHNHSVNITTSTGGNHDHNSSISVNQNDANERSAYAGHGLGRGSSQGRQATGTGSATMRNYAKTEAAGAHSHSVNGNTSTENNTNVSPHENRPPYYALAYIMKL